MRRDIKRTSSHKMAEFFFRLKSPWRHSNVIMAFRSFWTPFLILLIIVLLPLKAVICYQAEEEVPTIECKWASRAPVIDGRLDDICWREANWVTKFTQQTVGGSPRYETTALVVYDEMNLYVAFICNDEMKHLSRDVHLNRDGEVWLDDCVEVFMDVDHDHKDYFHVISNRSGVRFEEAGRWAPKSWDSDWQVGVGKAADHWSVEMAIPFIDMRLTPEEKQSPTPIPGETWGINFCRAHHGVPEKSSWTLTQMTFHDPIHFGHIVYLPFL